MPSAADHGHCRKLFDRMACWVKLLRGPVFPSKLQMLLKHSRAALWRSLQLQYAFSRQVILFLSFRTLIQIKSHHSLHICQLLGKLVMCVVVPRGHPLTAFSFAGLSIIDWSQSHSSSHARQARSLSKFILFPPAVCGQSISLPFSIHSEMQTPYGMVQGSSGFSAGSHSSGRSFHFQLA